MRQNRFVNLLQIGANVGILVGLILVGIQISQSNELTAAQFLDSRIASFMERDYVLLGDSAAEHMYRVNFEPENATAQDHHIADIYYNSIWSEVFRAQYLQSIGLYEGNMDAVIELSAREFASAYGLAYLDLMISDDGEPRRETAKRMREVAASQLLAERANARKLRATAILEQMERSN